MPILIQINDDEIDDVKRSIGGIGTKGDTIADRIDIALIEQGKLKKSGYDFREVPTPFGRGYIIDAEPIVDEED